MIRMQSKVCERRDSLMRPVYFACIVLRVRKYNGSFTLGSYTLNTLGFALEGPVLIFLETGRGERPKSRIGYKKVKDVKTMKRKKGVNEEIVPKHGMGFGILIFEDV